jgi:hypothetical protein
MEEETQGWTWRFRIVVAAFLLANTVGLLVFGAKFLVLGWLFNIPCGLLHYFGLEKPNDSGDPLGTAMIVAVPWAQTLLTTLVFGVGGAMMLWQAVFVRPPPDA